MPPQRLFLFNVSKKVSPETKIKVSKWRRGFFISFKKMERQQTWLDLVTVTTRGLKRRCRQKQIFDKKILAGPSLYQLALCSTNFATIWAGRRGLMDSTLGSGDRVRGFNSWSRRCGFSGLFFFFLLLLSPPCDFSLSQCLLACEFWFYDCVRGWQGKKRINMEKS